MQGGGGGMGTGPAVVLVMSSSGGGGGEGLHLRHLRHAHASAEEASCEVLNEEYGPDERFELLRLSLGTRHTRGTCHHTCKRCTSSCREAAAASG